MSGTAWVAVILLVSFVVLIVLWQSLREAKAKFERIESEEPPAGPHGTELRTGDLAWLCNLFTSHPELHAVSAAVKHGQIEVVTAGWPGALEDWTRALVRTSTDTGLYSASTGVGIEDVLRAGRCTVHVRRPIHTEPGQAGPANPRTFVLYEHHDVGGVSGVGVIADGVEFAEGDDRALPPGATPSTSDVTDRLEGISWVDRSRRSRSRS